MFYFNIVLTLVCLWLCMWINHSYFRPACMNSHRFKLFALRDELALLAMGGHLSENDNDYKTLMGLLNTSIAAMEDFSVIKFLKIMKTIVYDSKVSDQVNRLVDNLKSHQNEEFANIARKYFEINYKVFLYNTWPIRVTIIPLLYLTGKTLMLLLKVIKGKKFKKFMVDVKNQKEVYDGIDSRLYSLKEMEIAY